MKLIRYVWISLLLLGFAAGPAVALPTLHLSGLQIKATSPAAPALPWSRQDLRWLALPTIGAIKVKDNGAIASKYKNRASAAAPDYTAGIQGSGGDWEQNTGAAEGNFEAGVQDAIARKAFGKGVRGSGPKFVKNAMTLGAQRYPTGVANAEGAYNAGVTPYLDTIRNIALPPRGPKGSPANQQRANAVAAALRAKKVGS